MNLFEPHTPVLKPGAKEKFIEYLNSFLVKK